MTIAETCRAAQAPKGGCPGFRPENIRAAAALFGEKERNMEASLREICKAARDRQNTTVQQLADQTGIPMPTIKNFFATASKAPNVYNAGLICAALGVSLDRYFGITEKLSPEEQLEKMAADHKAELQIARLEGGMEQLTETVHRQYRKEKQQRMSQHLLLLLCMVQTALLAGYVALDMRIPDAGLIRGGNWSVGALAVLVLLAVASGVIVSALAAALRYGKRITSKGE